MPNYRDPLHSHLYPVYKVQTCSGQPLEVTTTSGQVTYVSPGGAAGDAFGRLRVSTPFTLFDSQHRYIENDKWDTQVSGSASKSYLPNESTILCTVTTASGDAVIRETKRVFPYQPGKSLLINTTVVCNAPKTNLRQRVGFFNVQNGVYFETVNSTLNFVIRDYVTGVATEERVAQSAWNGDQLNGLGESGFVLDPSKAQIIWMDIQWLGVGDVRVGFVINGKTIICHTFHHANYTTATYMTTAVLPLRTEIVNIGTTASNSTLKSICATVFSEGGYEGFNRKFNIALGSTAKRLATAHTSYHLTSIRLNSSRLDSVIVPCNINAIITSAARAVQWRVLWNSTILGGTWVQHPSTTIDYNITATGVSGGTEIYGGYLLDGGQLDLNDINNFNFQLGKTLAGVSDIFTLAMEPVDANTDVLADVSWFEIV